MHMASGIWQIWHRMGHGAWGFLVYVYGGRRGPSKKKPGRKKKTENQARGARHHRLLSAVLFRPLPAAAAGF
jgi:hypothetical protein